MSANGSGMQWEMGFDASEGNASHIAFYEPDGHRLGEILKPVLSINWVILGTLVLGAWLILTGKKNTRSVFAMAFLFFGQSVGGIFGCELRALGRYWFLVPGQFPIPWVAILNLLMVAYCLKVVTEELLKKTRTITGLELYSLLSIVYINLALIAAVMLNRRYLYSGEYSSLYGHEIWTEHFLEHLIVIAQSPAFEFHVYSSYCSFMLIWVKSVLRPGDKGTGLCSWVGVQLLIMMMAVRPIMEQIPDELIVGYRAVWLFCFLSMLCTKISQ